MTATAGQWLRIAGPRTVEVDGGFLPPLEARHVRVQVAYVGICHSDIGVVLADPPRIGTRLGHEVSGIVTESTTDQVTPGDRVVALVYNGYATVIDVPVERIAPVPGNVELRQACLAEPIACILSGLARVDVLAHERALVVGAGFMGLLLIRALVATGIGVDVVEPRPAARGFAETAGATALQHDAAPSQSHSLVFECSGSPDGLSAASEAVGIDGVLSIVGYHQSSGGTRTVPMREWNYKAITVINAHTRSEDRLMRFVHKGLRLLADIAADVDSWISQTVRFPELPAFLQDGGRVQGDGIKAIAEIRAALSVPRAPHEGARL